MSGEGESAAAQGGKCVLGIPVEPMARPANQHPAPCFANEGRAASFRFSHLDATAISSVSNVVKLPKNNDDNPYLQIVPGWSSINRACAELDRCAKRLDDAKQKAGELVGNIWNHLKTSPNIRDATIATLTQGTKILKEGGRDKVFERTFEILPEEEILKAYACYLSSHSELVIGTLYLSTKRLVFVGNNRCQNAPSEQLEWKSYKLELRLDNLSFVSPSSNPLDPSGKYILVVTRDNYEFWFVGFVSYEKALKNINEALQKYRNKLEGDNRDKSPNRE